MIRAASILSAIAALALAACATTSGTDTAAAAQPEQPEQPQGATAEQRAAAKDLAPVTRATFWSAEYQRNPADREAALEFSKALRAMGSAARAGEVAALAVQTYPQDVELLMALAAARLDERRPPAAVGPLEQAIAVAPSDWRAYSLLGVTFDQMGQHEDARARYRQALAISPDNPAVLTNLGMSYAVEGRAEEAERTLRQAAALPGAGPEARQNLALILAYQGKFAEAEQIALVDLPPAAARNNIEYARTMLTRSRRWDDLRR